MKKRLFLTAAFVLLCGWMVSAKDYTVAVLQLPVSESFVKFLKAIGDVTNNNFKTEVVPPSRAINMIETRQVDVLFPATVSADPAKANVQVYDYSSAVVYKMIFVLYANKNKPLDIATLKKGNTKNYQVETTASLARLFEFTPNKTTDVEASLKLLNAGRIDGLIYPQDSADPMLKQLGLKSVRRSLYGALNCTFGLQKGTAGGELDKVLQDGVARLKANGKLNEILAASLKNGVYAEWQP